MKNKFDSLYASSSPSSPIEKKLIVTKEEKLMEYPKTLLTYFPYDNTKRYIHMVLLI